MFSELPPFATLAGLCILVVEDEMLVAMALEDMLAELGCQVLTAGRVAKALSLIGSTPIDGAILDVNIAGEAVYPVAYALQERNIPFIFSSGYGVGGLLDEFSSRPNLSKPFQQEELAPMLVRALANQP